MTLSELWTDICVTPESRGGFEKEQIREQLGGFIDRFSVGRLRRFLSGIIYGNPFRAGDTISGVISVSAIFKIILKKYSTYNSIVTLCLL